MMRIGLFANLRPQISHYIIIRSYEKAHPRGYDRRHLREIVKLKVMNDKAKS
jgi:uncharacterized protein (UPF0335 family)